MSRAWTLTLLLLACTAPDRPGAVYDPDGEGMFDTPWPSDARVDEDGTANVEAFPAPSANELMQKYLDLAEITEGFGTNSPIYFQLDGRLDLDLLPDSLDSAEPDSPIALFDADPTSPFFGERYPVRWSYQPNDTAHQPADLLAIAPLWGFPLRPDTTYALVLTTDIVERNEAFAEVWSDDHPDHDLYAGAEEALFFQGLSKRDVAIATVFTTLNPVLGMDRVARFIDENIEPASLDQYVEFLGDNPFYRLHRGHYMGPVFQHGQRPYAFSGGEFRFTEEGMPILHSWDVMRMGISTPLDVSEPPETGWPVVIYQHGTGGDYLSFANGGTAMEVAAQLANAGIVAIGIDQPLHGTRSGPGGGDVDFLSFNYLNPDAGRANFRQGAVDALYLAAALKKGATFITEGGYEIPIDPDRIFFMGHSQGGLTGALALPWLGRYCDATVLSGAGGGLSITVVERKDPLDIAALLSDLLDFTAGEDVDEFHPVVALIQWLTEVTDPINYAPYWYAEAPAWDSHASSVLLFSGLHDAATPHRTAEAMAAAARIPLLAPGANYPASQILRGLGPQDGPLSGNAPGFDGEVTAALSQWGDADHYVIFDDRNAARLYREFLRSAAEGEPTIDATP